MRLRIVSFIGVVVLGTTVFAEETKILAKDLPAAVLKAIQEATRGATIKGYSREVEGGKTLFEVETTVNGHARDLLLAADGSVVEIEEAIHLDAVPEAVRSALTARGRVLSVEQVTRGKTISYEATVERNGKKSEVAVNADGKPIKP
jgi:uncharacterized membrane protein YkoI